MEVEVICKPQKADGYLSFCVQGDICAVNHALKMIRHEFQVIEEHERPLVIRLGAERL